ncbi:MAG: CpXC domain-containing protein [Kouleothrix sp.]
MAISYTEHIQLTCAHCRVQFATDAWALVDAAERPDLAEALRDGTLNLAPSPRRAAMLARPARHCCSTTRPAGLLRGATRHRRAHLARASRPCSMRWSAACPTISAGPTLAMCRSSTS